MAQNSTTELAARPSEKARFAATVVAQVAAFVTVLINYFVLYGWMFNSMLLGIIVVGALSIIIGLAYVDLVYDFLTYITKKQVKHPEIPVDAIIVTYSLLDLIALFYRMSIFDAVGLALAVLHLGSE
jgi:hypothetical protein